MGAVLIIGRDLRLADDGGGRKEVTGSAVDCTNMSYSSIKELKDCAARHLAILPEDWPFYTDVELEEDIPLVEVRRKCIRLRTALAPYSEEDLPENYWLRFLARMLREGWDFCATA